MGMAQTSLSQNKSVGGGLELHLQSGVALKITPLQGAQIGLEDYRELTKYQEYLTDEYCIACAYFQVSKGHFGTCPDLPHRKPFDGAKKGSGCSCWRLKSCYVRYNITQQLPEFPLLRPQKLIVKRRPEQQYKQRHCWYFNPDVREKWFWNWKLPRFAYEGLLNPEVLEAVGEVQYAGKRQKEKICGYCKTTFTPEGHNIGKFCSRSCRAKARWKTVQEKRWSGHTKVTHVRQPRKTAKINHKHTQGIGWGNVSSKVNGLRHWNDIDADSPIRKGIFQHSDAY